MAVMMRALANPLLRLIGLLLGESSTLSLGGIVARLRPNSQWLRRVPFCAQMERAECGAACLTMLLGYWGCHIPLARVRAACGIGRDGVSVPALAQAAQSFGLNLSALRVESAGLKSIATPAILYWRESHFVVMTACDSRGALILDPAQGKQRLSAAALDQAFSGIALLGEPGAQFKPCRARRPSLALYLRNLRPCAGAVAAIMLCALLLEIVGLVPPAATQVMIDHVIKPQRDSWLWALGAVVLGAASTQVTLMFLRDRIVHSLHLVLDLSLMEAFVRHLLAVPIAALQQRAAGDLMQRVQANAELREVSTRLVVAALDGVLLLGFAALMLAYHWQLGLFVLGLHAVRLVLQVLSRHPQRTLIAQEQALLGREQASAIEAFAMPELVKAFGLEEALISRYAARVLERGTLSATRSALAQHIGRWLQGFDSLGQAAILWMGGWAVLHEQMTLGMFAGFLTLHTLLRRPLESVVGLAGTLMMIRGALARIDDVLELPVERQGGNRLDTLRGEIEFDRVSFRYSARAPWVLRDISLRIAAGETVAIVGRCGAGKSTLARLLLGMGTPDAGMIRIDGKPLADLDADALRAHLSAVLQEPFLFDDTVSGNLGLRNPTVPIERQRQACGLAAIDAVIAALPQAYDTPLGPRGSRLSGGQRQRLGIARALVEPPAILVLDEATSHLDRVTEDTVQKGLRTLDCTQLIIAHRLDTLQSVDRIVVLDEGRIVQQGSYAELAVSPGLFRSLLLADERSPAHIEAEPCPA